MPCWKRSANWQAKRCCARVARKGECFREPRANASLSRFPHSLRRSKHAKYANKPIRAVIEAAHPDTLARSKVRIFGTFPVSREGAQKAWFVEARGPCACSAQGPRIEHGEWRNRSALTRPLFQHDGVEGRTTSFKTPILSRKSRISILRQGPHTHGRLPGYANYSAGSKGEGLREWPVLKHPGHAQLALAACPQARKVSVFRSSSTRTSCQTQIALCQR
jgi:hypothetical protein